MAGSGRAVAFLMQHERDFLPALRYRVLTPIYDVGIAVTMPERRFKMALLDEARIQPGHRVLDVGCGTGTLLVWAARRHPEAFFSGIDPDPAILARARTKIARNGVRVELREGSATALPYENATFDRVFSTLMVHHLPSDAKRDAFRELARVLTAGGELHLADFGPPHNGVMRFASAVVARIGHEYVDENLAGQLPSLLMEAGFDVTETGVFATIFGTVRMLRGRLLRSASLS